MPVETSTAQVGIAPDAAERLTTVDDTQGLLAAAAAEDEDVEMQTMKGDHTPILTNSPVITVEMHGLKD